MHHTTYVRYVDMPYPRQKSYGCFSFLWDAFVVVITGGFWLIWIFVREMRRR